MDQIIAVAQGGSNPQAAATVQIVAPESTAGCRVRAVGSIVAADGQVARFVSQGGSSAGDARGNQIFFELRGGIRVRSTEVDALSCAETSATVFGQAQVGGESFGYRIDLRDGGSGGSSDFYRLRLANGFDSGEQPLRSGFVDVRP